MIILSEIFHEAIWRRGGMFGWKKLRPAWEFTTKGILWRLLPSAEGYIAGEDRDIEAKSVSFFSIEQKSGKVCWQNFKLHEKWWISMDSAFGNVLFLHGFATPDMPEPKGIYAVHLRSGELLWSNDEMTLLSVGRDGLYATSGRDFERSTYQVELTTGRIVREVESEDGPQNIESDAELRLREFVEYPILVEDTVTVNEPEKTAIDRATSKSKNATQVEMLRKGDTLVIGYHENLSANPAKPNFQQQIAIVGIKEARTLFSDTINSGFARTLPDSFFCIDGIVYYVKERRTLRAVPLTS